MKPAASRRCVGCRQDATRQDLLRLIVAPDGAIRVDRKAKLPGRGAWVHPRAECIGTVVARPATLARALRVADVDASSLLSDARAATLQAITDGLSQSSVSGGLVAGHDRLALALDRGEVVVVLVASDASRRTIDSLRSVAGEVPFVAVPLDMAALGTRTGRAARAAIGVRPTGATRHLRRHLDRWPALS
ncbi:MAG: putative RNA-binding protein YlxR (DUF448 family) [Myxococcota bacterium]